MYFIQVVAYSGLMLLVYLLLLRDKPLHKFNRAYLLIATILPLVLPLLQLPEAFRPQTESGLITGMLPEFVVGNRVNTAATLPAWLVIITALYSFMVMVIAVFKITQYIKLHRLIKSSTKEEHDKYILLKHTGYGPGSWGRYILLPEGDVDDAIIRHEQQHVQLYHTRDMVFMSMMQAALWPNPFIHFIKKELVQVHEFQADAAVAMKSDEYSRLLLSSVFGTCTLPLTHSFIIHPIKRRIMMLNKNKSASKKRGILAAVCTLALAGGIVTMQSCEQKAEQKVVEKKTDALTFAHKMPEPGYNLPEFLGSHIVYPQEAKDKGIEGRVFVKFVVDEKGHITDIHTAGTKNDPILAEAALKVVAQLPDWKPGEDEQGNKVKVMYTLPISFKLDVEETTGLNAKPFRKSDGEDYSLKIEKTGNNATAENHTTGKIKAAEWIASGDMTEQEIDQANKISDKLHGGGLTIKKDANANFTIKMEAAQAQQILDEYNDKQ